MKTSGFVAGWLFLILLVVAAGVSWSADISHTEQNIAIEGYDPTAYFTENRAVKGDAGISYSWGGVTWHFATQEGKTLFMKSPQKYVPQFGGYCANGLSDGHKIEGNPQNWRVIDGKLYLYFSKYGREQWSGNVKPLIDMAGETWHDLKKE